MPQETEEKLLHVSKFNQTLVDGRNYGSNREKDQILSTIRDASMKLDAMKAFRTIRDNSSGSKTNVKLLGNHF